MSINLGHENVGSIAVHGKIFLVANISKNLLTLNAGTNILCSHKIDQRRPTNNLNYLLVTIQWWFVISQCTFFLKHTTYRPSYASFYGLRVWHICSDFLQLPDSKVLTLMENIVTRNILPLTRSKTCIILQPFIAHLLCKQNKNDWYLLTKSVQS